MGTYREIADTLQSMVETVSAGEAAVHVALRREMIGMTIGACGAAGTAKNTMLYKAPYDCRLIAAAYIPGAVCTEHADNFAVLDLNKEDGAAGGLTSIASYSTDADVDGTIAARVGFDWSIVASDTLDAGEVLVLEITKAGTGLALPEAMVYIVVERL